MTQYPTIGRHLPRCLASRLFGDREQWGHQIRTDDPHWQEWSRVWINFYDATQKRGVGEFVNNAGYQVLATGDYRGTRILEIGPGHLQHLRYWWDHSPALTGRAEWPAPLNPPTFCIADVQQEMLDRSASVLADAGIPCETHLLTRGESRLPFRDNEFDHILTFYTLEHIYPLCDYLDELRRVLKGGGCLSGAIPAEGGLAWGMGRFLTSRRWLKNNTTIDPDKIICWEHPNFAPSVLRQLDLRFINERREYWPLKIELIDVNLVVRFVYRKAQET